jgi:hypothetical protein
MLAMVGLFALSLPFISAAEHGDDAPEGVGDASASLVGAALEIGDADGLTGALVGDLLGDLDALPALELDLGLLDGLTSATTRGEPDARASMSPVRIGSERPHDVSAGPGQSQGSDAIGLGAVSALLSGVTVSPFNVSAEADEDEALALIDAVNASLDVLGAGGLDIGLTEVRSHVTRVGAVGGQDLVVEDLSIALGDILPEELLGLLPLDAILDLLEELGLDDGLGGQLDDAVDDVEASCESSPGSTSTCSATSTPAPRGAAGPPGAPGRARRARRAGRGRAG